ncbi:hypothetical protein M2437_002884 [Methylorubrum pseudosasae]|nr:hypothetical protein [Methylorubrum pseudosasae]
MSAVEAVKVPAAVAPTLTVRASDPLPVTLRRPFESTEAFARPDLLMALTTSPRVSVAATV